MIIGEYQESHPSVVIENLDYSINQDAKSIFLTQHKNGTIVPYHINDVKNIFITLNRSLAKVGYNISYSLAGSKDHFIPIVMTDIKWGTLIWFNNPATISIINRPRLVSAAYAAFRPTLDLTRRLNAALVKLENAGKITPEQCYLLKVNPIAQRLLTRKTVNDPDNFFEETPLEILKELRDKAYMEGSLSRQVEIDLLTEQTRKSKLELDIERQKLKVETYQQNKEKTELEISHLEEAIKDTSSQIALNDQLKVVIEKAVKRHMNIVKTAFTIAILIMIGFTIYLGSTGSWLTAVISAIFALFFTIIRLWKNENVSVLSFMHFIEHRLFDKQCTLRRYSETDATALQARNQKLTAELQNKKKELLQIINCTEKEKEELDRLVKGITCVMT